MNNLFLDYRTERRIELVLQKTGRLVTALPSLRLSLNPSGQHCYIRYNDQYVELGKAFLMDCSAGLGEFMVVAKGALYHELAHWIFSPRAAFVKTLSDEEKRIYMALEDCRIETWFALKYKKAVDYFFLLYMNAIHDNPRNKIRGGGLEHKVGLFLLTYGRKYLPKELLKKVMRFDWVTEKLLRDIDDYVKFDFLRDNWKKAKNILKRVAAFVRDLLPHAYIQNLGPDMGWTIDGGSNQTAIVPSNEREKLGEIVKDGSKQQRKELQREIQKEKEEEEKRKAEEEAKAEEEELGEEDLELGSGEEGEAGEEEAEEEELEEGEAESIAAGGSESDGEAEETGEGTSGGGSKESSEESEECEEFEDGEEEEEEGETEEGIDDEEEATGADGEGASTNGEAEMADPEKDTRPETDPDRIWEEVEEKCIEEMLEEVQNFRVKPKTRPDYVSPNASGHKGRMNSAEIGRKAVELAKYLKGLDSLEIKEKRRKRKGTLDNSRLHLYKKTNRIFRKKQLDFGDTINLGILIDTSGSMDRWIPDVVDAARILYRAGTSCNHRVTLRAFATTYQLVFQGFFSPNTRWKEDTPITTSGGTNIYGALADFATDFAHVQGKNVLFIISDGHISGGETGDYILPKGVNSWDVFRNNMRELIREFQASGVEVQFISIGNASGGKLSDYFPVSQVVHSTRNRNWFNEIAIEALKRLGRGSQ